MTNKFNLRIVFIVLMFIAYSLLSCQSDTPLENNDTINPLIGDWVTSFSAATDNAAIIAEMDNRQMDISNLDSVLKDIAMSLDAESFSIDTGSRFFSQGSELFKTQSQVTGSYQITDNTILLNADNGLIEEFVFEILEERLYLLFSQYATACQCTTYAGPNNGMPWGMETDKFHGHFTRND